MRVRAIAKARWAAGRAAVLLAACAAPAFAAPSADPPAGADAIRLVSAYPPRPETVLDSPLARALGGAKNVLVDAGADPAFKAQIRRAVGRHPVYHLEASRREDAKGHVRAERAAILPRLSASLSGDYVLAREFGAGTDNVVESLRPDGQFNVGVSASQLLFDGGAAAQRIRGARAHERQQAQSMSARVNELALAALAAHHDALVHQAILALADEFVIRHDRLLADVKERESLGVGSRADVMQAQARLAAAKARVAHIRESARLAEIRYEEFFGARPGALMRPSFDALTVKSREEAAQLAALRNPLIGAAEAGVDRAQADFRAARAARLPEVRANVRATKFDLAESDDYDVRAGLTVDYDFYAGGGRGAAISRARALAGQQKYDEERVRREVARNAAMAFERRQACEERLSALADAVTAHAEARTLVSERFRVARGALIDLLQAENDYFEAGVAYLAGLGERDMAVYELMEHTGELLLHFSPEQAVAEYGEHRR